MEKDIKKLLGHDKFEVVTDLGEAIAEPLADIQRWVNILAGHYRVPAFDIAREYDIAVVSLQPSPTPFAFASAGPQLYMRSKDGKRAQIFQAFVRSHYATAGELIRMYREGANAS